CDQSQKGHGGDHQESYPHIGRYLLPGDGIELLAAFQRERDLPSWKSWTRRCLFIVVSALHPGRRHSKAQVPGEILLIQETAQGSQYSFAAIQPNDASIGRGKFPYIRS